MHWITNRLTVLLFILVIAMTGPVPGTTPIAAAAQRHHSGFNDEYVFATSRGLADMEGVHPALKLPLFPVTIVLDTALLPFALIAGLVTQN